VTGFGHRFLAVAATLSGASTSCCPFEASRRRQMAAVRAPEGDLQRAAVEEPELGAEVDVTHAWREGPRADSLVPRRVTAPAERLAKEGEVANVRRGRQRGLGAPVALAGAARAGERLVDGEVELHREVQVRPRAVAAGRRPPELLAGDDALTLPDENALAQVAVDRPHVAAEARDDHVVVDRRLDVLRSC
jgi:hypothetical protein